MDLVYINKQMIVLTILILIAIFFVYTRSFKDNIPTCDGYMQNVFLYVLLGLLLTCFSVLFIAKRGYPITSTKSLIFFAAALLALFAMYAIKPENVLSNHLAWLAFIISMSVPLYVTWRYSDYKGTVATSIISTVLITVLLVSIAYLKPEWISLNLGSSLTVALVAGILAWTVPMLFGIKMTNFYKGLSALFVFIFCGLILYDTRILKEKAKMCIIPNYPTDSLGLFLDVINLFSSVSNVRN
jgi:FtsH-binding integral membrane protein